MKLLKATLVNLEPLAKSFNYNYSITIDFLFFAFDTFTLKEKKTILRQCPLKSKESTEKQNLKTNQKENVKEELKEITITIHAILEDRLMNLVSQCDKLTNESDAIEFLLFVIGTIDKEVLIDLVIQYSIENLSLAGNGFYIPSLVDKEDIESTDPIHINPILPEDNFFSVLL